MQELLQSALGAAPILPLVQTDDPAVALALAKALAAGGMTVVEVVQRSDDALACLETVAAAELDLIVAAGTVVSTAQADACIDRGARIIVSPGLDADIVTHARRRQVEVLPGILSPSEAQHALRLELEVVKFFPAAAAGGPAMIAALAAAFGRLRFVPTGGVSTANLGDYLALDSVLACGGSWLTPAAAVARSDYREIETLARAALSLAAGSRQGLARA